MDKDTTLRKRIKFYVIHCRNSPYGEDEKKRVHPLVNDLIAPIITLKSTFVGQTDVNNERLRHYVQNSRYGGDDSWIEMSLNPPLDSTGANKDETLFKYSMSWVISDTLINRMHAQIKRNDNAAKLKMIQDLK